MDTNTTTINSERVYLCSKETFIEMKAEQKAIATILKNSKKITDEYLTAHSEWFALEPYKNKVPDPSNFIECLACKVTHKEPNEEYKKYVLARTEWMCKQPLLPNFYVLKQRARVHNIIYGIVRGRTYEQIENKVKEHNLPSAYGLRDIIKEYGMDQDKFTTLKGLL
jgi:hypothetical protein